MQNVLPANFWQVEILHKDKAVALEVFLSCWKNHCWCHCPGWEVYSRLPWWRLHYLFSPWFLPRGSQLCHCQLWAPYILSYLLHTRPPPTSSALSRTVRGLRTHPTRFQLCQYQISGTEPKHPVFFLHVMCIIVETYHVWYIVVKTSWSRLRDPIRSGFLKILKFWHTIPLLIREAWFSLFPSQDSLKSINKFQWLLCTLKKKTYPSIHPSIYIYIYTHTYVHTQSGSSLFSTLALCYHLEFT